MNKNTATFIDNLGIWKKEVEMLRTILLDCSLTEDFKWGKPAYTFNEKNVVIIQPFKIYLAILFPFGDKIDDGKGILIKTGPNTKRGRQIRFEDLDDIKKKEKSIKKYVELVKKFLAN